MSSTNPGQIDQWFQDYLKSNPASDPYKVNTVDPTKWDVTPDQTVAGNLDAITAKDGVLMQRANTRALQGMNDRGLLNSSMATGAAQSALYDAAMPIAQADAGIKSRAGEFNANTVNAAKTFNANSQNVAAASGAQAAQQLASQAQTQRNALETMSAEQVNVLSRMAAQQGMNLQTMSAQQINDLAKMATQQGYNLESMTSQSALQLQNQKEMAAVTQANFEKNTANEFQNAMTMLEAKNMNTVQLANIEAQYKQLGQASQSATSIMSGLANQVALLMKDDTLDATAKQNAIDVLTSNAELSLQIIGGLAGDIDLSAYFA